MRHHFQICKQDDRRTSDLSGIERPKNLGRSRLPPGVDDIGHIKFIDPEPEFAGGNVSKETLSCRGWTVKQDPRSRVRTTAQGFAPRPNHTVFEAPTIVCEPRDIAEPEKRDRWWRRVPVRRKVGVAIGRTDRTV